ncbi:hypothetical protein [Sphingopyxis sp.]|uniref:hypothetical protein n=1 Tax=Sphingopyxis sp. TaxID=1908224 RepID=UPI002E05FD71|nr:hypothetical protein [Sphingopyxis sp.]
MRYGVIACSLLALSFTLSGCDSSRNSSQSSVTAEEARWTDKTVEQLREAIDRRAAHGLDRMGFAIEGKPGSVQGDAALTKSALR